MKTLCISDLHYGHQNIMDYENRPFRTVEEMDYTLTQNWNSTVSKEDKVIVPGDFSFYNQEKTKKIVNELKGYKILIMGNHDFNRGNRNWWLKTGFNEVIPVPILMDKFILVSHDYLYLSKAMPYCNMHGHTHSTSLASKQYFNVSADAINFTPIDYELIKKQFLEIFVL